LNRETELDDKAVVGVDLPGAGGKVLFIGGYSRSGSTLLDCMLGQLPGVFSTGELGYIWSHGLRENRLCGCGSRFLECSFWRRVGETAFGGWEQVDVDRMVALERAVNRHRYVPLLLMPQVSPAFRTKLEQYTEVLGSIYRAIHLVSGARLIVDSTIDPAYGFVLAHVRGLDLRLVHMVRDSRATAFSWTRWRRQRDRVDTVLYQRRFHPAMTAVRWVIYHLLIHLLAHKNGAREMRVLYEDVVTSPEEQVRRIMRDIGEAVDETQLSFLRPGEVILETNHTVAGSLMRLKRGPLPIRVDDEWRTALRSGHRRVVTLLTWPLLRGYGYRRAAGARSARSS
jgi:hypothetical protein